jgi:hypothetical protein
MYSRVSMETSPALVEFPFATEAKSRIIEGLATHNFWERLYLFARRAITIQLEA